MTLEAFILFRCRTGFNDRTTRGCTRLEVINKELATKGQKLPKKRQTVSLPAWEGAEQELYTNSGYRRSAPLFQSRSDEEIFPDKIRLDSPGSPAEVFPDVIFYAKVDEARSYPDKFG